MSAELNSFVREALGKGESRESVAVVLEKAGWEKDEVASALDSYADLQFSVPVPKRRPYLSAREAFLYLLLFVTLYISAWSFGSLLFDYVNKALPDPLQPYEDVTYSLRQALAALIVAAPIYLGLSVFLARTLKRHPAKKGSKIRKWLTYVTLFIAAVAIVSDLIALLNSLLGGELTLRFVLKVAAVLVIAGTIFGYYLWDLRKEEKE